MPFNHFDHIAGLYNQMAEFSAGEEILRVLNLTAEINLLDVGGGTGRVANSLRGLVRQVVVADPSREMLKYAGDKNLPAVCTPAEALPFPPDTFDRIIIVDAFHHVQNQEVTAGELWRILRPGGRLLIIEPDIQEFSSKLVAIAEKLLLMHSHFLSADAMAALFKKTDAEADISRVDKNAMVLIQKK